MAGLLDGFLDDPTNQMLLGLLGGTSPNFGQNVLQAFQFAQSQKDAAQKRQLAQMQLESGGLDLQAKKRSAADDEMYRAALQGAPDVTRASLPSMAPTQANAQALQSLKPPSPYEQAAKMAEYLRTKKVPEQYIKPYIEQMEKLRPKFKADQQLVKMPDGSLGMINIADDGSAQVVPYTPAEKLKEVNRGGTVGMAGEYTGKLGAEYSKTMEPGEIARLLQSDSHFGQSNALGWYNATKPQVITGPNGEVFSVDARAGTGAPVMGADGKPLSKGEKPLTESQAKAAIYYGQMRGAAEDINKITVGGFSPTGQNAASYASAKAASELSDNHPVKAALLNALTPAQAQRYQQAAEKWSEAYLRFNTGAATNHAEITRYARVFFPMPGDSDATIAQKNQSRLLAEQSMRVAAGNSGASQVETNVSGAPSNNDPLGIRK